MRLIKQAALGLSVLALFPLFAATSAASRHIPPRTLSPGEFTAIVVPSARPSVAIEVVLDDFPPSAAPPRLRRIQPEPVAKAVPQPTPKPTPKPKKSNGYTLTGHSMRGVATWYCKAGRSICMAVHPDRPGVLDLYAAAGPSLRHALGSHWRNRTVHVCGRTGCVNVVLADWCACGGGHTIDLYWDAFNIVSPGSGGESVRISW